ncbi:MAG: NeuD/PglB/VioB family sugar acetyltransferase [Pseudomonadota bacterium]
MSETSLIVIGGGGNSRSLIAFLNESPRYRVEGYTDLSDRGDLLGKSWLGPEDDLDLSGRNVVIGLTYANTAADRSLRYRVIDSLSRRGALFPTVRADSALVDASARMGRGGAVFRRVLVNSGTHIGEYAILNSGSVVEHDCRLGDHAFVGPNATLCGGVQMGDRVFVGAGAVVRDDLSVCDDVTIGIGAVITRSIETAGIYVGNPARRLVGG